MESLPIKLRSSFNHYLSALEQYMGMNPGFSRSFAKEHGVTEAIIARYLCNRIRKSKTVREEKKWFYNSITKLATRWPYLSRTAVAETLKRLQKKGLIEIGRFNRFKQDKTQWYSAKQEILDAVEENVIYFEPQVAKLHGVCAGVLILNFVHLLRTQPFALLKFSPKAYSKIIPFSVSAIRNGLNSLIDAKLLKADPGRRSFFGLGENAPYTTNEKGHLNGVTFMNV